MNPDLRLAPDGSERDEYVAYVRERHHVWERRSLGLPAPWSASPVLQAARFTNNFRVLDTGSQYVLRMVQDAETPEDVVLRAFLYRLTNLPEPWEVYRACHGRWPNMSDLRLGILENFLLTYDGPMFSSAYMISPGIANKGMTRPQWLAKTVWDAFSDGGLWQLDPAVFNPASAVGARVDHLCEVPRVAGFLALQIATDIGYSDLLASDEDEFVVVGPGSKRGLAALGLPTTPSAIRELHAEVRSTVVLDVHGTPRPLSLMDVQNTLCEFGKYHAMLDGRNPRRRFTPATEVPAWAPLEPAYPNHWS